MSRLVSSRLAKNARRDETTMERRETRRDETGIENCGTRRDETKGWLRDRIEQAKGNFRKICIRSSFFLDLNSKSVKSSEEKQSAVPFLSLKGYSFGVMELYFNTFPV